jgi:hypothetical protein
MARVLTYDSLQQQERALPGARQETVASPSLFTAQADDTMAAGKALISAGADAGQVAVKLQEQRNADMLFQAETNAKAAYIEFENSVRERKGSAAWGATKDTEKFWDDTAKKHGELLENDIQRKLFNQQVTKLKLQSTDSISKYELDQRRVSLNESGQASIVGSINLAAGAVGTPDEMKTINAAKGDIDRRITALAKMNGWSPEYKEAYAAEKITNLHQQVLQNMADKNPDGAKLYYEANKAEINGTARDSIEKTLRVSGLRTVAQSFGDEIEAKGMDEASALKAARAKYSGEEEHAVTQEIKMRFSEKVQIKELAQKKAGDDAWGIYARTGSLKSIPASTLASMDGQQLLALQRDASGVKTTTDWNVYTDLRKLATDNPDKFKKIDLRTYYGSLDQGKREQLLDMQDRLGHPDKSKEFATDEKQIAIAVGKLELKGDKKAEFESTAYQALRDEQKRNGGKQLDEVGRQKVIDKLIIDGEVLSGSIFLPDPNRRVYQIYGSEDINKFDPKVPSTERTKIEAALKRSGLPVTDAAVKRLFKQKNNL